MTSSIPRPTPPWCQLPRAQIQKRESYTVEVSDYCSRRQQCVINQSALTDWLLRLSGVGQLHRRVTIGSLPDDVLLKIFKSFVGATEIDGSTSEEWHTLVHICRRWRYLAFTSPRHLNLQLICGHPRRSVKDMLDIWPELPIYIHTIGYLVGEERDDFVAALRLNHRVSGIHLGRTSESEWERFAPLIKQTFPVLTHLWLQPRLLITNPFSRSFLGGFAPCLRVLYLDSISFPTLPSLLLSATDLVRLSYDEIPSSGYIPPHEMVTGLSTLTRLQSLSVTFRPESPAYREIRIPPPHTRTLLPALTDLQFRGVPEYMEDLVVQLDTPLLESTRVALFHQEVLEVSELSKFIHRADKLPLIDQAEVTFSFDSISVTLSQELLGGRVDPKTLWLHLNCRESDLRLSYLAQFCASCLPTLSPFESLHICVPYDHWWEDVIDDPDPQWLGLLHLFKTMQGLYLSESAAPRVAQALGGLPAERIMEVLPALETVFISRLKLLGHVKEAISEFADMRQLSGHPVFIGDWDRGAYYWDWGR